MVVLVSGASGIIGYGILRSLRISGKGLQLIGTTIFEDSVAEGFCDIFEKAPLTGNEEYLPWLIETIKKHSVDMIIPGIDADMYLWAENIEELKKTGTEVLLNKLDLISLCKDKWEFYNFLIKYKSPYSIPSSLSKSFWEVSEKFGMPLLLKPRNGFGSKGIVRVYDEETFLKHQDKIGETLIVQPLIGDDSEEYTTSAFCDGKGGFFAFMTLKRKLSKDGYTEKAEVANLENIENVLKNLCEIFKPIGPTNFQFRIQNGILKLLEINPRVSSSTSIRSKFGYNESKMAIEYFLEKENIKQPVIKYGKAVRYIEDLIIYK